MHPGNVRWDKFRDRKLSERKLVLTASASSTGGSSLSKIESTVARS